jgi:hypothetical protein
VNGSEIIIELLSPAGMPAVILVTWPPQTSAIAPLRSNAVVSDAAKLFARAAAGYRTWQNLGRQVREGERGIAVIVPVVYRNAEEQTERARTPPPASEAGRSSTSSMSARPTVTPCLTLSPSALMARHQKVFGTVWLSRSRLTDSSCCERRRQTNGRCLSIHLAQRPTRHARPWPTSWPIVLGRSLASDKLVDVGEAVGYRGGAVQS